jgi:primosomal protein N' (replication factor Y)
LFLESELNERSAAGYPPYARVSNVVVSGASADSVRVSCESIAALLRGRVGEDSTWEVLGPADCVKARVKDRFRRHIVVKSPVEGSVGELLASCVRDAKVPKGLNVAIDVDAHDMM